MALTKCKECGTQVSTTADACPKCGAKPTRPNYRWILVLAILGAFVVFRMASDRPDDAANRQNREAAAQRSATARAAQEKVFAEHRDSVLKLARDALDRDDLKAAGEALDPLPAVRDRELQQLQASLRAKRKEVETRAEIAQLENEARALKSSDTDNGYRIYSRLAALVPENKDYTAKLGVYSKKKAQADAIALAKLKLELRQRLARTTEEGFLKNGQSVTVSAVGKDKTDLQIEYALVSKAFTYQVQHQTEFIAACRDAGFKRIVLKDGFRETWTITL